MILIVVIALVLFSLIEIVNLFRLEASIASYATYWKNLPDSGTFTYVALGDSAAQGIGASKPQLGYVGLLAKQIQQTTGKTVRIVNLSVSGARVADVIAKQLPELKNYKPDLITVEIGANDATHYNAQTFQKQYNELAAALPAGTVIANVPYFGGRIRDNAQALNANQYIQQAAAKYNLPLVDLQTETRQTQSIWNYSSDFFHPSNRGYRNWDAAFWKVVKPLL